MRLSGSLSPNIANLTALSDLYETYLLLNFCHKIKVLYAKCVNFIELEV